MRSKWTTFGVVAWLLVTGCKQQPDCDFCLGGFVVVSTSPDQTSAKMSFNSDGSQIAVDFGPVVIGNTVTETILLSNVGSADLTFLKVFTEIPDPSFSTDLRQGPTLVAGGTALPVTIRFTPQSGGAKQSTIVVTTDSSGVPTITFLLTGEGATRLSVLVSTAAIDFGNVLVNTTAKQTLMLTNQCGVAIGPTIERIQGADEMLFATEPAVGNLLPMPDQQAVPLTVSFSPQVASATPFQATLPFTFCYQDAGTCTQSVALRGVAVSTCLIFSPAPLDFGSVATHQSVTKAVTLSNVCSNAPVHLTAAPRVVNDLGDGGASSGGAFQPGTGFPSKDTAIVPGQSIDFPIAFISDSPGAFTGQLEISTDDATSSGAVVLLRAAAGP